MLQETAQPPRCLASLPDVCFKPLLGAASSVLPTAPSPPNSWVDPWSNTDYSIRIRNIQPKDAGTYYCVTYNIGFPQTERESGTGIQVSVAETLVRQPRGPLHVRTGDVLTLACEVTGHIRAGSVRWYKQRGDCQELIFPTSGSNKRVTRKDEGSSTDFTIFIPNVVPEDAGIYCCVKQKGKSGASGEVLENGPGTVVFVDDRCLKPTKHLPRPSDHST
uniref:Uncharacterized protein n=1 Tax=Sphaerodactylus townsendi TaxID=933632 RepID=A0ACB8F7D5_9SAUR